MTSSLYNVFTYTNGKNDSNDTTLHAIKIDVQELIEIAYQA